MRRTLRLQILLPAASLLVVAVVMNAVVAAVWSSRRAEQEMQARLTQVGQVLAETSFPQSAAMLDKLRQLTGADYLVATSSPSRAVSERNGPGAILLSTLTIPDPAAVSAQLQELSGRDAPQGVVVIGNRRYRASRISPTPPRRPEYVWVLFPEDVLWRVRWSSAWPPLIVGAGSLLLLIPIMLHVSHRLGRRIARVQHRVADVADGQYTAIVDDERIDDEIHQLVTTFNALTARLRELQLHIERTERARLLGQFAGGLAHQLRNAITGAKLAVQLHGRRCPSAAGDDSLAVALKQLALTEQQLRGLLSIGRRRAQARQDIDPTGLLMDVLQLVTPIAEHIGVSLERTDAQAGGPVSLDRDAVQAALLNLTMNALEAAGPRGVVRTALDRTAGAITWTVSDNGPGPTLAAPEQMFEPFVTTKPEGAGLGLALARQVATDHHGTLIWSRVDGWTCFALTLPEQPPAEFPADTNLSEPS